MQALQRSFRLSGLGGGSRGASSGKQPGMLLNTMVYSIAQRLRNPDLNQEAKENAHRRRDVSMGKVEELEE